MINDNLTFCTVTELFSCNENEVLVLMHKKDYNTYIVHHHIIIIFIFKPLVSCQQSTDEQVITNISLVRAYFNNEQLNYT